MTLSRIILAVNGAKYSSIAPRWLTRIFVFGDIFSFIIQASGAGLRVQAGSGNSNTDPNLGSNIIVGGLIFQIIIFGIFIIAAFMFNTKFCRDSSPTGMSTDIPWQQALNMLYVTSLFIMARNIFRAVEYAMGSDGYLLGVEWGVYVFDAALMTLTMAWFLWRYPNRLRQSSKIRRGGHDVEFEAIDRKAGR